MCGQRAEKIYYKDTFYSMASLPLDSYLEKLKEPFNFEGPDSGLYRGYSGTWEIRDDLLLLVELEAYDYRNRKVDIQFVFPGEKIVFANWYTGKLRLPLGDCLFFDNDLFGSIYMEDLILQIKKGRLINTKTISTVNKGLRKRRTEIIENANGIPF